MLEYVDLTVHSGEAVALLGRNGVGKTTLLRSLSGTLAVSNGDIVFEGRSLSRLKPYEINRLGVSLVPEGRRLFPNLTVTENLQLAARPGGIGLEGAFELFPRLRERRSAKGENLADTLTVTGVVIDDPGSGYTSAPGVAVLDGTQFDPIKHDPGTFTEAIGTATLKVDLGRGR